jgi:Glycosyl hydrolases family 18
MSENMMASMLVEENFCTHIVLDDFTHHSATGPVERPDPTELLEAVSIFKAAGLKILMQVGAYRHNSKSTKPMQFFDLAAKNISRVNYVRNTLEIVKKRAFDGVSIHWFYPGCPAVSESSDLILVLGKASELETLPLDDHIIQFVISKIFNTHMAVRYIEKILLSAFKKRLFRIIVFLTILITQEVRN